MVEQVMVEHVMVVVQTMNDWMMVNRAMVVMYYAEVEVTEERRGGGRESHYAGVG